MTGNGSTSLASTSTVTRRPASASGTSSGLATGSGALDPPTVTGTTPATAVVVPSSTVTPTSAVVPRATSVAAVTVRTDPASVASTPPPGSWTSRNVAPSASPGSGSVTRARRSSTASSPAGTVIRDGVNTGGVLSAARTVTGRVMDRVSGATPA